MRVSRPPTRRPTSSSQRRHGSEQRPLSTPAEHRQIVLSPLTVEDWASAGARIYRAGIEGGNATFESEVPDWETWSGKRVGCPMIAARSGTTDNGCGELLGWAALSRSSSRPVYRGVAEVSIYVAPEHAGRGVGRVLLTELIDSSERAGFWTLEAGIFPENVASIKLHERCGFRLIGARERIGQMPVEDGRWRDVLLFERRSATVGADQPAD